mmetsp:Transcript_52237/g.113213  ORF Transcript_52237/g.113213 Transcript_52237/m.113213 type:complete len:239 (+) Transcript_52237:870-1586(+)
MERINPISAVIEVGINIKSEGETLAVLSGKVSQQGVDKHRHVGRPGQLHWEPCLKKGIASHGEPAENGRQGDLAPNEARKLVKSLLPSHEGVEEVAWLLPAPHALDAVLGDVPGQTVLVMKEIYLIADGEAHDMIRSQLAQEFHRPGPILVITLVAAGEAGAHEDFRALRMRPSGDVVVSQGSRLGTTPLRKPGLEQAQGLDWLLGVGPHGRDLRRALREGSVIQAHSFVLHGCHLCG